MYKSNLKPGQTSKVGLKYLVRRDFGKGPGFNYKLLAIPQAGAKDTIFNKTYSTSKSFFAFNQFKPYQYLPEGKFNFEQELILPIELGVIFGL
jgi:hypothetical protein